MLFGIVYTGQGTIVPSPVDFSESSVSRMDCFESNYLTLWKQNSNGCLSFSLIHFQSGVSTDKLSSTHSEQVAHVSDISCYLFIDGDVVSHPNFPGVSIKVALFVQTDGEVHTDCLLFAVD
jgi:hypothetical protein